MRIGVLALQGDFLEHVHALKRLGITPVEVRQAQHLTGLAGLIMPGGESTTFGIVARSLNLIEPLREFALAHPTWGTCAGAIFLAKHVLGRAADQTSLNLMDITIERNAFGRQLDSFIAPLVVNGMSGDPYEAVFIRAPLIRAVGEGVETLAQLGDGRIVAAKQGHWLATSFHPELTRDDRFHALFVRMVERSPDVKTSG
jgi:pyridoxal 5'-phosphate synthase pdxT subunit